MKKVLLLSVPALALSAGAVFAGSAPPPPWPDTVEPAKYGGGTGSAAMSTGSESYVEQIGNNNKVDSVTGSGSHTTITYGVDQSVTDNKSANFSEIYQGKNNNASSGNTATAQQKAAGGAMNSASTKQDGKNNTAVTQQNTNATGVGTGSVILTMPTFTFTDNTGATSTLAPSSAKLSLGTFTSVIEQNGDGNIANLSQGLWGSAATAGTDYSYVSQHT